ncbi:hypothetical protein DM860_007370 [Cuscuta australis]|uniref:PWWP domain-containing protein n=1 Tax=Cuscuta australis TaxID=267555 RepID=A0A328E3L3_9ASTE|nr:hypothetical protein DM860_007370 [Cuscuta australis]
MLSVMSSKGFDSDRRNDADHVTDLRASIASSSGAGNGAVVSISTGSGEPQGFEDAVNGGSRSACSVGGNLPEARAPPADSKESSHHQFVSMKCEGRLNAERKNMGSVAASKSSNLEYDMMLSKFDDFAAKGKPWAVGWGYEMGDMVWGKVKSHPWWPGHIFHEAFATTSVRRSKRDGHILVAFFGDSSYGWFEPSELVPFDSNFHDKSQQTNLRSFTKAVEEAVEELSRRCALGLICRCRSVDNFRPSSAEGFFEVDLNENESNFIYSASQIKKARESFHPRETLAFARKLALTPMSGDSGNITFIKNKAIALAYRKAVFAPHDPTYAEAFGAHVTKNLQLMQPVSQPSRVQVGASVGGRLVSFEAVGKGKPSLKHSKATDKTEKDRYLFKRRDEPENVKSHKAGEVQAIGASKQLPVLVDSHSIAENNASCTSVEPRLEQPRNQNAAAAATVESHRSGLQAQDCVGEVHHISLLAEAKPQPEGSKAPSLGSMEKAKSRKRPFETSRLLEEDKKKKKKVPGMNTGFSNFPEKQIVSGGVDRVENQSLLGGDSGPVGEEAVTEMDHKRSEHGAVSHQAAEIRKGIELPQLLCELQCLALNPFYALGRDCSTTTRTAFLRFRSLVYQKSLENESPTENESVNEAHSSRLDGAPAKPKKPSVRVDDPSRVARKRAPSDRQEEISVKKKKKMNDLKMMTGERRDPQRSSEVPLKKVVAKPPELSKKMMMTEQQSPAKVSSAPTMLLIKFPPRGALPSLPELKVKFSRFGPLDLSATRIFWKSSTCRLVYRYKHHAEAALKYAESSTQLFGNTDVKCSIREADAPPETTATASGSVKGAWGPPQREGDLSAAGGEGSCQSNKDSASARLLQQQQLKSCLKRAPPSEEAVNGNGSNRSTTRVKFDLGGGEDSNRGELSNDVSKNHPKTTAFTSLSSDTSTTTTTTTNVNKNISKGILPTPPQFPPVLLPPPAPLFHDHFTDATTPHRNVHNFDPPHATPNIDISQQMLSLLLKCHEVVANLTNLLGYTPYCPL